MAAVPKEGPVRFSIKILHIYDSEKLWDCQVPESVPAHEERLFYSLNFLQKSHLPTTPVHLFDKEGRVRRELRRMM